MPTTRSFATLLAAALHRFTARRQQANGLRDLDERTLADIGVHPSELSSIEAESLGHSALTRRRIVAAWHPS